MPGKSQGDWVPSLPGAVSPATSDKPELRLGYPLETDAPGTAKLVGHTLV
jgi:hypothetical protein